VVPWAVGRDDHRERLFALTVDVKRQVSFWPPSTGVISRSSSTSRSLFGPVIGCLDRAVTRI
jgi:hypothetical protein